MIDLEDQLLYTEKHFPLLTPQIKLIMQSARQRYSQAGEPYGPGDRKAYLWFQEELAKYKENKRVSKTPVKLV